MRPHKYVNFGNEDSMKICTKCGIDKPLSEFYKQSPPRLDWLTVCKACVIARTNARQRARPTEAAAYARKWRAKNPKRSVAATMKWRAENQDKAKAIQDAWLASPSNKERRRETVRKWKNKNIDRIKVVSQVPALTTFIFIGY